MQLYGKEGFKAVHEYLVNGGKSCMAGFVLKNTLSDNGGVTRGICKMDAENNLTEVVETKNIVKTADGAEAAGKVIDVNSLVSMNMWGLTPDFLDVLEEGFKEFFEKEVPGNPLKAEYLISDITSQHFVFNDITHQMFIDQAFSLLAGIHQALFADAVDTPRYPGRFFIDIVQCPVCEDILWECPGPTPNRCRGQTL